VLITANPSRAVYPVSVANSLSSTASVPPEPTGGFLQRRIVLPLIELLRYGTSPRRLAWSIAVGFAIGINPLLGSTTLISLAVAGIFRLNLVASQLATHLSYPLEIALFYVFIRTGDHFFHTGRMPLHREALLSAVRHHPIDTTRLLWTWEWHALIVWAVFSLLAVPLLVVILTPMLARLEARIHFEPPPDPA
jgi:uncharacterized protein (DUF2062 family)